MKQGGEGRALATSCHITSSKLVCYWYSSLFGETLSKPNLQGGSYLRIMPQCLTMKADHADWSWTRLDELETLSNDHVSGIQLPNELGLVGWLDRFG